MQNSVPHANISLLPFFPLEPSFEVSRCRLRSILTVAVVWRTSLTTGVHFVPREVGERIVAPLFWGVSVLTSDGTVA